MEWLSKAGDLLDKVDQLAAETLADDDDRDVEDDAVLALLDEAEADAETGMDSRMTHGDGAGATGDVLRGPAAELSPRGELESEVARLKKALQKKASQVEQLVASQRALLKSKSQREEELSEQATKLRQEVDQVAVQRKLVDQGRKHAEQQVEAMKQSVKSKSEELGKARQQIQMLQEERDSALQRVAAMEDTQRQHEELMSDMQTKYDAALGQLSVARMEQKQELHDLQDREDSLSSATVQYTAELARAERRRIQSESAARKAEALQREAEEQACELQRALGEQERLLAERDGVVAQLQQALDAGVAAEDSERSKLEAEARESSKRAEQAEIQLRQVEKELAASTRAAVRASSHSNTAELEEQLNKMCQDVLAKQALLQQVMSEQTALRSRLESEALRNADLQNEVARLQAAKALVRSDDRELELGQRGLSEPVAESIQRALKARDLSSVFRALDAILQHSACAVAQDTAVRTVAGCYLLVLQVSHGNFMWHACESTLSMATSLYAGACFQLEPCQPPPLTPCTCTVSILC